MKYIKFFTQNIVDTPQECYVPIKHILICYLKNEIYKVLKNNTKFSYPRIYLPTKVLKHAYDKRREFTELHIEGIHQTLSNPDNICLNEFGLGENNIDKRGDFIFFKKIVGRNKYYVCPVEISSDGSLSTVSFFQCKNKYIQKFPTLWDREDGVNPPS